jgi:hypothetical protein
MPPGERNANPRQRSRSPSAEGYRAQSTGEELPDSGKIDFGVLVERLADPDYPEDDIKKYVTLVRDEKSRLILQPDPAMVRKPLDHELAAQGSLGLGLLNNVYRGRRRSAFEKRIKNGDASPVLLAEGDSWFQYPLWLEDVVDHLNAKYNVFCVSAAGDEITGLKGIAAKAEYADYVDHLTKPKGLKALLLSGGGNDIVGDEMVKYLRRFDPSKEPDWHIDRHAFRFRMGEIGTAYSNIIERVRSRYPDLPIVIHGYDYAVPLPSQGFNIPPKDGWLGEPLRGAGINTIGMQKRIVVLMIDAFHEMLASLAGGNGGGKYGRVYLVDNRKTVNNDWADELHPTNAGFGRVAGKFHDVIKAIN